MNDLVEAVKGTAADEQDVRGVDLNQLLLRMLSSALRRNRRIRSFHNLQKSLLNALSGDISCNRNVLTLLGNLIDLIDVDNAKLRALHVVICRLNQLQKNVLDVLTDIAGFGQRGRIRDRKRNVQKLRQCLGKIGLAGAGRSQHQNVGLLKLDTLVFLSGILCSRQYALVVVVNRYGQNLLGFVLTDDILIQKLLDLRRLHQVDLLPHRSSIPEILRLTIPRLVLRNQALAGLDALVTDIDAVWSRDQLMYLKLRSSAE